MFWPEFNDSYLTEFDEEAYRKAMRREGYEEGYKEGYRKGCESYHLLMRALIEKNRIDDLKRSTKDKAFRQQMFREFGIDK